MTDKVKKLVLLSLPYLIFVYLFDKLCVVDRYPSDSIYDVFQKMKLYCSTIRFICFGWRGEV